MHVRIKICGITKPADARAAAALGADAIGLNFYPKSVRNIDADTAKTIVLELPPFVTPVALFVNEPIAQIQMMAKRLAIGTVQVHADTLEPIPVDDFRWIPAFTVASAADLETIRTYAEKSRPAAILVDARMPGMYGGTGQTAPWHLLAGFDPGAPVILAGGLTPDNVAEAIRIVRPYAVDVASGVESTPGQKDAEKMRRFIDAVRAAS